MIRGKVWRYGDHINTDLIIPGRFLDDYDPRSFAAHAMEDLDPTFAKNVKPGDIIVAGRNFGCGSSREQAPLALKNAGISAVIVASSARIFYRNAINIGLPIIICPEVGRILKDGDEVEIDIRKGVLRNVNDSSSVVFDPLPGFLLEILEAGGLVPFMKEKLAQK